MRTATTPTRRDPLHPTLFPTLGVAQLYLLAAWHARDARMFEQIVRECVEYGIEGEG